MDDEKPGVSLARDDGDTVRLVDQKSVGVIALHMISSDDLLVCGVDRHELVPRLHRDEETVRHLIVVSVACLARKIDPPDLRVRDATDDEVRKVGAGETLQARYELPRLARAAVRAV